MGFRFRFQAVLNYRRRLVEEAQMALAQARHRLGQIQAEIQDLEARRQALLEQIQTDLTGQAQLERVRQRYAYLEGLNSQIHALVQAQAQAEEAVVARRQELEEALRRRKVLDKLREKDWRAFIEEMERLERIQLDDLSVARYRREDPLAR